MPAEAEHAEKYRENRAFLNGPPAVVAASGAWAATVAFYAAVHLIEQLAAREGVHHTRHTGQSSRDKYLATHPSHAVLYPYMTALLSASMVARYYSAAAFAAAYPGNEVQDVLIDQCLAAIEAHVKTHIP